MPKRDPGPNIPKTSQNTPWDCQDRPIDSPKPSGGTRILWRLGFDGPLGRRAANKRVVNQRNASLEHLDAPLCDCWYIVYS